MSTAAIAIAPMPTSAPTTSFDDIPSFSLKEFRKNSYTFIIGSRMVGKTTLLKNILRYNKTLANGGLLVSFFGHNNTTTPLLNNDAIVSFDNALKEMKEKPTGSLVVMDEANQTSHAMASFKEDILENKKKYNTEVIEVSQTCFNISPKMQNQIDYVILFKNSNSQVKKQIYNSFVNNLYNYERFESILNSLPIYGCLVIDTVEGQVYTL